MVLLHSYVASGSFPRSGQQGGGSPGAQTPCLGSQASYVACAASRETWWRESSVQQYFQAKEVTLGLCVGDTQLGSDRPPAPSQPEWGPEPGGGRVFPVALSVMELQGEQ